jgi:hypothetical protein
MSSLLPLTTYAADQSLCISALADFKNRGSLTLLLGAGISSGMGLPSWKDLVRCCAQSVGINRTIDDTTTSDALMAITEEIEAKAAATYFDVVKTCKRTPAPSGISRAQPLAFLLSSRASCLRSARSRRSSLR